MSFESVQELVCRTADGDRSRTAIEVGDRRLSYGEVEDRSNNLANFLTASGAAKGAIVGILAEDPVNVVVCLLACLKAGLVFVPLDPRLPVARLAALVAEVSPRWFLAEPAAAGLPSRLGLVPEEATRVLLVEGALAAAEATSDLPLQAEFSAYWDPQRRLAPAAPDQMCYLYFTSGSTGEPKAIAGRLKAIDHFIRWQMDTFGVREGARVSQLTNPAFDASLRDFFLPLCAGGTVCAPPDRDTILDPVRLARWLDEGRIEIVHCVPSLFRALLNGGLDPSRFSFSALRWVFLAGEPLFPSDVARWSEAYGDRIRLVNLYGPSETTMVKLFYRVEPADQHRRSIPIGKPMRGARAVVVDAKQRACAPGQIGEILIRTPFRSLGYFNRPDLTRQVFIPSPFSDDPEDIVYQTGDLGRMLQDGNFEFLGRKDHQVKIRGVRIELAEVEGRLRAHPAIVDLAVIDRDDASGEKLLCAYVVLRERVDPATLRQFLADHLPQAAIPTAFVVLDELPRTISGKVDRRALPAPREPQGGEGDQAPRNAVEGLLAALWAEVLRVDKVAIHDHFFAIGGHSLLATQVLSRIRRVFGREVSLRAFFAAPTVAGLAVHLAEELGRSGGEEVRSLERVPRNGALPLSFAQERLWFLDRLAPGSAAYNLGAALRLKGGLDAAALERAITEIARRHDSLRTTVRLESGRPVQEIVPAAPERLPVIDLAGLPPERREVCARGLAAALVRSPFDLARGPLMRVGLLRLGERDHLLLVALHHIVTDGWSNEVFARELGHFYAAFAAGKAPSLAELPIQYADFAVWQRQRLQGEYLQGLLAYWRDQLGPVAPVLHLPADRPRPAVQTTRGASETCALSAALSADLGQLSRRSEATLFMTLLAAFQILLSRYSGQEDLCVGSPVAGRTRLETEGVIGLFVNMLVIRSTLRPEAAFPDLLARVRETVLGAEAHQDLPFEKLVEELQPQRDLEHSPLFQVMFVLQNAPRSTLELPGLELEGVPLDSGGAKFDLSLGMTEAGGRFQGYLEYNADLFDASSMSRMLGHFETLLADLAARPGILLRDLALLTGAERDQLLSASSATAVAWPARDRAHTLFEDQARSTPEAPAVIFQVQSLTYGELEAAANRLARHLRSCGIGPDVPVGLCLERSADLIVALLGILKAGGAYLPLDPHFPAQRLAYMLEDSGAPLLLTQRSLSERFAGLPTRVLALDVLEERLAAESPEPPAVEIDGANLAYVIYTSGSTGRPKGVGVPHGALTNFLRSMAERLGLGNRDLLLAVTSISFDIAGLEILLPLTRGAAVEVVPRDTTLDGRRLRARLEQGSATLLQSTPSTWRMLLDAGWSGSDLQILCGGEALPRKLADDLAELGGQVWNLYGPTETTIWSAVGRVAAGDGPVSLGQPIANTAIFLLDRWLSPVPPGAAGELCIGGLGLARCYLGRPELTAERFVPSPFSPRPGERIYRTGDLARYGSTGELQFLGRMDDLVKLRGFRIEPGEIETLLERMPGVRQAVVVAREDVAGDRRLVAYLTPGEGGAPRTADLLASLREALPDYMVPSSFLTLDAFPLTANGKVDRRSLPRPDGVRPDLSSSYVAPRSGLERTVAEVWRQVLRLDAAGLHDNFFDLGGHSLLLVQVHARLCEQLARELSLIELFQYPTIAALAAHLARHGDEAAAAREEKHIAGLLAGRERLSRRRASRALGA